MAIDLKIKVNGMQEVTSDLDKIQKELASLKKSAEAAVGGSGGIGSIAGQAGKATAGVGKLTGGMATLAAGIGGAIFAIKEIGGRVVDMSAQLVAAYYDADKIAKLWEVSWVNNAGAVGLAREELDKLSATIQKNSTYDDDLIRESQAMLLQYRELGEEVFPRAQQAATDMAAKLGINLVTAAQTVGKALNDPVKGIKLLEKQGVSLTSAQEKQIRALVESGKTYEAQTIIIQQLGAQFAGAAKEIANTPLGKLKQMENLVGDLKESVGQLIVEAITPLVDVFSELFSELQLGGTDSFDFLRKAMRSIGLIIGAVIRGIVGNIKILVGAWQAGVDFIIFGIHYVIDSFQLMRNNITAIIDYIGGAIKKIITGDITGLIDYVSNELPKLGKKITENMATMAEKSKDDLATAGSTFGKALDSGIAEGVKAQQLIQEAIKFELRDDSAKIKGAARQLGEEIGEEIVIGTGDSIIKNVETLLPKMLSFNDLIKSQMNWDFSDDEELQANIDKTQALAAESLASFVGATGDIYTKYQSITSDISQTIGNTFASITDGSMTMADAVSASLGAIGNAAKDVVAESVTGLVSDLLKKSGAKIVNAIANIYEWFSTLPPPIGIPLAIAGGGALAGGFFAIKKKFGFAEGGLWSGGPAMIIPTRGGPIGTISEDGRPERISSAYDSTSSGPSIVINSQVIDAQGLANLSDKISLANKKNDRYMRGG